MIYPFHHKFPKISPTAFITDYVTITGDVEIGDESSIWFNTVPRLSGRE